MNKRIRLLLALAALSGLWALWAATRPPEVTSAAKPRPAAPRNTARGAPRQAESGDGRLAVRGQLTEEASADPFRAPVAPAPRVVAPPPPPPVVVVPVVAPPPPPPPRPTLPYRYVGMLSERDGGDARVFLMLGDKMLMARRGETLEGGWRLDTISPQELQFVRPVDNTTLKLSVDEGV